MKKIPLSKKTFKTSAGPKGVDVEYGEENREAEITLAKIDIAGNVLTETIKQVGSVIKSVMDYKTAKEKTEQTRMHEETERMRIFLEYEQMLSEERTKMQELEDNYNLEMGKLVNIHDQIVLQRRIVEQALEHVDYLKQGIIKHERLIGYEPEFYVKQMSDINQAYENLIKVLPQLKNQD